MFGSRSSRGGCGGPAALQLKVFQGLITGRRPPRLAGSRPPAGGWNPRSAGEAEVKRSQQIFRRRVWKRRKLHPPTPPPADALLCLPAAHCNHSGSFAATPRPPLISNQSSRPRRSAVNPWATPPTPPQEAVVDLGWQPGCPLASARQRPAPSTICMPVMCGRGR